MQIVACDVYSGVCYAYSPPCDEYVISCDEYSSLVMHIRKSYEVLFISWCIFHIWWWISFNFVILNILKLEMYIPYHVLHILISYNIYSLWCWSCDVFVKSLELYSNDTVYILYNLSFRFKIRFEFLRLTYFTLHFDIWIKKIIS